MPNTNVGFGLKPLSHVDMGTNAYFISSSASAIYQGSPVIATNGGTIARCGSASGDTLKLLGVFYGCEYVSSTTGKKVFSNYWPGSGADTNFDIIGYVYDNPNQRFVVCTDGTITDRATAIATIFDSTCCFPLLRQVMVRFHRAIRLLKTARELSIFHCF